MEGGVNSDCGCLAQNKACSCGADCKCDTKSTASNQPSTGFCSCGEGCKCNPCTCSKSDVAVSGKSYCKCGANCSCNPCNCVREDLPHLPQAVA